MRRNTKIIIASSLFFALILVRAFAKDLFYDPFIEYFQNDYLLKDFPPFRIPKLMLHYFFRYLLNAVISLAIIYVLFQKKSILKFSLFFYGFMFFILSISFLVALYYRVHHGYLLIFYLRRFIIHPLFVLLLIPAFYYNRK